MADKLFIRATESGEIHTWGAEIPDAIEIVASKIPLDWYVHSTGKYLWDGTKLVVRSGWTEPVLDPTVSISAVPETPVEPEA